MFFQNDKSESLHQCKCLEGPHTHSHGHTHTTPTDSTLAYTYPVHAHKWTITHTHTHTDTETHTPTHTLIVYDGFEGGIVSLSCKSKIIFKDVFIKKLPTI